MTVRISIDNQQLEVDAGTTLAAALAGAGVTSVRRSVSGEWRAPFCGMGCCFECRVTVDGVRHQRSCQIIVHDGMEVQREG
jgi:predicted molibdopterin-dependent oxidoreductase YjgC